MAKPFPVTFFILTTLVVAIGWFLFIRFSGYAQSSLACDLNNDKAVNVQDLGILLSAWGKDAASLGSCGNGGTVEVTELGVLLSNWGKTGGGTDRPAATLSPNQPNTLYTLKFSRPVARVAPGDIDGDGKIDFVSKSDHIDPSGTIWIEARRNNGEKLWEHDTTTGYDLPTNPLDLPILSWDFDGDGKWEVYYQYYSNGWHHRLVKGATGEILADDTFPDRWTDTKVMAAVAYRGGRPRLVINIDRWWGGKELWMFEAWTEQQTWSLAVSPGWPYVRADYGAAHDTFRTADVDVDGSDDEIIAGCVVVNADGSLRYDIADKVPSGRCGDMDGTFLGFYSSIFPQELIHAGGDAIGKYLFAAKAATGELLWTAIDATTYFPEWDHFHTGHVSDKDGSISGAEMQAVDKQQAGRTTNPGITVRVEDGHIISTSTDTSGGCKGLLWDGDEHYDCPNNIPEGQGQGDIGEGGCEESWGVDQARTMLEIAFNPSCPAGTASRWSTSRQYRQDVATFPSGYSAYYINPLYLPDRAQ